MLVAAVCVVAVLAGCANTPYQQPALNLPEQWQHATTPAADANAIYGDRWWTAFAESSSTGVRLPSKIGRASCRERV